MGALRRISVGGFAGLSVESDGIIEVGGRDE